MKPPKPKSKTKLIAVNAIIIAIAYLWISALPVEEDITKATDVMMSCLLTGAVGILSVAVTAIIQTEWPEILTFIKELLEEWE